MGEIVNPFLFVYASLYPIVNPIGGAPIFFGLTSACTARERGTLAFQVARNGFLLLLASLLVGSHVLQFFGLTLPVVRIAGGLVVATFGWQLLHAKDASDPERAAEVGQSGRERPDAFYPLTMPLTVGPGSISVAIALGSQRPAAAPLSQLALLGTSAVAGLLAVAATIYVCYRYAEQIIGMLGERGTNVVLRMSAFILLCIGIQIIWNGYQALMATAP
jgi:multiple antibiotic resistance protein